MLQDHLQVCIASEGMVTYSEGLFTILKWHGKDPTFHGWSGQDTADAGIAKGPMDEDGYNGQRKLPNVLCQASHEPRQICCARFILQRSEIFILHSLLKGGTSEESLKWAVSMVRGSSLHSTFFSLCIPIVWAAIMRRHVLGLAMDPRWVAGPSSWDRNEEIVCAWIHELPS